MKSQEPRDDLGGDSVLEASGALRFTSYGHTCILPQGPASSFIKWEG